MTSDYQMLAVAKVIGTIPPEASCMNLGTSSGLVWTMLCHEGIVII